MKRFLAVLFVFAVWTAPVAAEPNQDRYQTYISSVPATSTVGLFRIDGSDAPANYNPFSATYRPMPNPHFLYQLNVTSPAGTGTIQFYDAYLTSTTAYGAAASSYTTNIVLTSTMTLTPLVDISTNAASYAWDFSVVPSSGITYIKTGNSALQIKWR